MASRDPLLENDETRHAGLAGSLEEALAQLDGAAAPGRARGVLDTIREETLAFLEAGGQALFSTAREGLFQGSREAATDFVQAEYFDAVQEVGQAEAALMRAFLDNVRSDFTKLAAPGAEQARGATGDLDSLSLVDTQALSDIIAVQEILRRRESDLARQVHLLNDRMATAAGAAIGNGDNPVGPYRVAYAFRDALQNMGLSSISRQALFSALELSLISRLGELYEQLLARLRERLPETLGTSAPPRPGSARPRGSRGEPRAPAGGPASAMAQADDTRPASPTAPPHTAPAGRPAAPMQAPGSPTPANHASAGPAPVERPDAQTTLGLLRTIARRAAPGTEAPPQTAAPPDGARAGVDPRLVEALAALQGEIAAAPEHPGARMDLAAALRARLGAAEPGAGEPDIGPSDGEALELATRLLGAVLRDPMVADGIRQRLARLEPTLVRLALTSPGFLQHAYHPARRLLDTMARLPLPARPEPASFEASISAELDALLEPVIHGAGDDTLVYSRAMDALEAVAARQTEQYARRVTAVIETARAEEAQTATAPGPPEGTDLAAVEALRVGEHLAFVHHGGVSAETLAWSARRSGRLVFVDRYGRRSRSMDAAALAHQLERGEARRMPESSLLPLERGIFAVFQELQEHVTREATQDPVTGLANRKAFLQEGRALVRGLGAAPAALLYVTIDELEATVGEIGGKLAKALLAQYAQVLQKHFAGRGVLGALEAGTFTVILQGCDRETALDLADKHRYSIFQSRVKWRGRSLALTVSIGVAPLLADRSFEDQMQSAAIACRKAQKDGGNRTQAYREGIAHLVAKTRVDWGAAISRTLNEQQLRLFRQRIEPVDPGDGALPHYEVLLRLRGAGNAALAPMELIAAAERAGRMVEVDRWVVEQTLRWLAAHPEHLAGVSGYAVNLSGHTLTDPAAIARLGELFPATGVAPEQILFEVTETAAIRHLSAANESIEHLRALGCRFCLDDFGTGSATYSYLKHLSVDLVKIDGMFVKDIADNPADLAMVRSVNEVSHYMGKKTVAEFVESQRILEVLREVGVDYAQGYSIHKPAPLPGFTPHVTAAAPSPADGVESGSRTVPNSN